MERASWRLARAVERALSCARASDSRHFRSGFFRNHSITSGQRPKYVYEKSAGKEPRTRAKKNLFLGIVRAFSRERESSAPSITNECDTIKRDFEIVRDMRINMTGVAL